MDPELAFIQSNLTHCRSYALALDPFCGTGGLMLSAAHHGCSVLGTEINWQVVRAVGRSARAGEAMLTDEHSIRANFQQYSLEDRFLGVVLADSSQHQLWRGEGNSGSGLFDCIISDPPYGVREKGRRLGGEETVSPLLDNGSMTTGDEPQHFPEKTKYTISDVYLDLLNLAAKLLVVGGRVSFWFPVMRKSYSSELLPSHPCLELTHNCEQLLTRLTSRRLLVYVKVAFPPRCTTVGAVTAFYPKNGYVDMTFREMLFNKHECPE